MLDILKKLDVHNACVVVTRYFGGIKLGGGGLIRAYSGAVRHHSRYGAYMRTTRSSTMYSNTEL